MLKKLFRSEVLGIRDFTTLFSARVLATISIQTMAVIVGWHVYELSSDPLLLGLIGLAEALPAISFSFVSGHAVDNHKPAFVYRLSLIILIFNSILVWSTTWPWLAGQIHTQLIVIFAAIFVSGIVRSFTTPSLFALVPYIVPRRLISQAAAWNSSAFQMAAVIGPALGGLIYGAFGPVIAFAIPPLFVCLGFLMTFRFSHDTKTMRSPSKREPFWQSVRTGIRFIRQEKVLLSSMTLDMFSVLFGGAVAILPVFADQVLHTGAMGLGILRAAPSVGSGLIAIFLAMRPMKVMSGKMLLIVVAGFGLSILAFGMARDFSLAFLFLVATGAFDGVSMVIRNTLLQLLTPDNMRGRVSSLGLIFITSSNEIGAFESGLAAKLLTLIPSILFGGSMTLFVVGTTAWLWPELAKTKVSD